MHFFIHSFNTSYLTNSYIIFILKMESVCKITILVIKMMVNSGLQKYLWNSSMQKPFYLLTRFEENHKFRNKNNCLPTWRKIRNSFFLPYCTWPNSPVRAKILSGLQFEVKMMFPPIDLYMISEKSIWKNSQIYFLSYKYSRNFTQPVILYNHD